MKALILIDLQVDFCAMGALEIEGADQLIPMANELMEAFDLVVATKDWHPGNHQSFAANHPWRKPGQLIDLNGSPQMLWTIHCVQNTFGAEFHSGLSESDIDEVIYKGTDPEIDGYSGFYDAHQKRNTGLHQLLSEKGIKEVTIMGLPTEYTVQFTALDALALGYKTTVLQAACRSFDPTSDAVENIWKTLTEAGARVK